MVQKKLRIVAFALCWVLLPPTLIAADQNTLANPVAILKGDYWTYQNTDELTGKVFSVVSYTVTELDAKSVVARTNSRIGNTNSVGIVVYDPNWNFVDNAITTYIPNDGRGLPANYKIGSEWKTPFQWKSNVPKKNGTGFSVGSCPTTELIHLKIGNFVALQCVVHTTSLTGNAGEDTISKKIVAETTSWYAPEIGHWVKQTIIVRVDGHLLSQTSAELVSFNNLGVDGQSHSSEGQASLQGNSATINKCAMQDPISGPRVIAKVTREISVGETHAATENVEKQIGVKISPAFADLKRVLVVGEEDQKFQTLAAIPPSMTLGIGDLVAVIGRHRDVSLPCNFIPWTVETIIAKAN